MIYSMTGFAAASHDSEAGSLNIELKSVNSRYQDIQFRIAEELRSLEPVLREILNVRFVRGKFECRISATYPTAKRQLQSLNQPVLEHLKALDQQIRQEFPQAAPLTVNHILNWPGIFVEDNTDQSALAQACVELFKKALSEFMDSRVREGEKLKAVILERVQVMRAHVKEVAPHVGAAQAAFQEKLRQRLIDAASLLDEERIRQEVAVFAMRIDIAEEIARLSTHLDEVERVLKTGGACGKRLDFLMQELNREANTLGSKSVMSEITQKAVELKLLIEQMREQVQNLE